MAFDGITLKNIIFELNELINGKVDSIYEPTENSLLIKIYNKKLYCLNIDTSATNYRIHMTTHLKKNPKTAPNFCMLLRKHLIGSRVLKIYMDDLERICYIDFECFDNKHNINTKTLVIELMGKYSNVILLNDKNIVIDALKKYNNQEKERNIIPNKRYYLPHSDKASFLNTSYDEFNKMIVSSNYNTLDTSISNLFTGISKMFIECAINELHISNEISSNNIKELYNYILLILNNDNSNSAIQYKNGYSIVRNKKTNDNFSINFFLDDFYFEKTQQETYLSYRNNLLKVLENTLNKLSNKMNTINEKIKDCANMNQYKIYGELLIANIYKFDNKLTDDYVIIENYYNNNEKIKIPINPSLSISKNADKYFKKYNKLKKTLDIVKVQEAQTNTELNYIETLIKSLEKCKTIEDVDLVYNEISQNILFNDMKSKRQSNTNKKIDISMLNNYIKTKVDDFDVLVGKNNKQNDYITLKIANDNDMWFHAKDIHGSHLILRCNGEVPKISTIKKCAQICAYYSKAKYSSHVPVDYCQVKFVKKPHKANPGYVIYSNNKTIYVDPSI